MLSKKQWIEKNILKLLEKFLTCTTFDRIVIEHRRKVNRITGFYPHAVFFSKRKSKIKYCIVRYTTPTSDLLASGIQYVFCYHQLLKRGYTPLIDIEYAYSYKQGLLGEHNSWDLCFKQPITVAEAVKQPYVLAAGELFSYSDDSIICMDINADANDHFIHVKKENYKQYYSKIQKYTQPIWQVRDELIAELDEEIWNRVSGHRIMGVFLRENFSKDVPHTNMKDKEVYSNHPMLPGIEETIEIIKNQLAAWKYDFIFLSTVYTDSLQRFIKEFGNKVLFIKRCRFNIDEPPKANFEMNERELYDGFLENKFFRENVYKTYLKEVVALSRCNYLIGGASSGMAAALVMNGGKYEDIYILEDKRKINRY